MQQAALKLVESLNNETFLDGRSFGWIEPFTFESTGVHCGISFLGVTLWDCDSDEREWIGDDEQEPLRDFIIRQAKEILADINVRMAQI